LISFATRQFSDEKLIEIAALHSRYIRSSCRFQIFHLDKIDHRLIRSHCVPNIGGNESHTEYSYRGIRKNSTTRASRHEFLEGVCRVGVRVSQLLLCTVHAPHAPLAEYARSIANTRVVRASTHAKYNRK